MLDVNGSTAGSITCGPLNPSNNCNSGSATEVIPANSTLSIAETNSPFPSGLGDARFSLRLTP
jgi:hypothetical protein